MRTCTIDGCDKQYKSKGLCKAHYRLGNERVVMPCDNCGSDCLRWKTSQYANRYCSWLCRSLAGGKPASSVVPDTHPSRSSWVPDTHPSRLTAAPAARPIDPRVCGWCDAVYLAKQAHAVYCSERCAARAGKRRRKAREHGAYGTFSWGDFMRLARLFDYCCAYCGVRPADDEQLEPDHVVPLSRGGANTTTNLLPACHRCNGDKSALLLDEWRDDRHRRGLPPRVTTWSATDARFVHLTSTFAHAA